MYSWMFDSLSAFGSLVQTPCGPRKSGMPDSVEIPAPVSATMRAEASTQRQTLSMLSLIALAPSVLRPAVQAVIGQTLVHQPGALVENAGAAGEIHGVDA